MPNEQAFVVASQYERGEFERSPDQVARHLRLMYAPRRVTDYLFAR